eukprot:Opistho-2@29117
MAGCLFVDHYETDWILTRQTFGCRSALGMRSYTQQQSRDSAVNNKNTHKMECEKPYEMAADAPQQSSVLRRPMRTCRMRALQTVPSSLEGGILTALNSDDTLDASLTTNGLSVGAVSNCTSTQSALQRIRKKKIKTALMHSASQTRTASSDNGALTAPHFYGLGLRRSANASKRKEGDGKVGVLDVAPAVDIAYLEGISATERSRRPIGEVRWVPPRPPRPLLQHYLWKSPWHLLIACMFLNRTTGHQVRGLIVEFFRRYATPEATIAADTDALIDLLRPLGLYRRRAHSIRRMSEDFIASNWTLPSQLYGIGKYAEDAYRIFCLGEWAQVEPNDHALNYFHEWLVATEGGTLPTCPLTSNAVESHDHDLDNNSNENRTAPVNKRMSTTASKTPKMRAVSLVEDGKRESSEDREDNAGVKVTPKAEKTGHSVPRTHTSATKRKRTRALIGTDTEVHCPDRTGDRSDEEMNALDGDGHVPHARHRRVRRVLCAAP